MSSNMEIMYLQKQHPHPNDARIRFEEGPHLYYIDEVNENTSVTTLVHSFFQEFDADKVIKKMRKSSRWQNSPYYGMTDEEIKQIWEDRKIEASEAGTKMHYDIELFYNNIIPENDSLEWKYFQQFHQTQVLTKGLIPYRTEWVVFDLEYQLAGSIDMIFQVDKNDPDTLMIYDWKRCKKIEKTNSFQCGKPPIEHLPDSNYWHYALQLNMYRYILEKNYGKKITGLYLVCLHPLQKNYQQISVPFLDDEVQDILAIRKLAMCGMSI